MPKKLETIINTLPKTRDELQTIREIILANAVMVGEISAPTFGEVDRITFLGNRFTENGLQNISIDEAGNAAAVIPGKKGKKNILVSAHVDTVFGSKIDHAMAVGPDFIKGPGIGDNSLGVAAILTLPEIIARLGLKFDDNIILAGFSRSLGRGNLGGIRFFLDNNPAPIRAGVCVEGIQLGRLSYSSLGMLRAEIEVQMPSEYDWTKFDASGAVSIVTQVVQRINEIPLPTEPKTRVIFGSMNAGTSFGTQPTSANLRFEIRSEQEGMVAKLREQINDIIEEIANRTDTEITLSVLAQRKPGGLAYAHPMVKSMRGILDSLQVKPHVEPSVGELSELIQKGIPAVTLGLTHGEHKNEFNEQIQIGPLFDGLSQLVGLLQAIDGGLCDE